LPFFLWLRFLTTQKLCELHRRHFGVKARDVSREAYLYDGPSPQASSRMACRDIGNRFSRPSKDA
jgi:RNA polymerase sigma-70 factor (ECF subfamily)